LHRLPGVNIPDIQPLGIIFRLDDCGHACVDLCNDSIGFGSDDGCGFKFRAIGPLPMFPQAGKSEEPVIRAVNEVWTLLARHITQPFIIAIGRNEAATAADGVPEGWLFQQRFTARIDQGLARLDFLHPGGDEPQHTKAKWRWLFSSRTMAMGLWGAT
jgi:hypothetical protein